MDGKADPNVNYEKRRATLACHGWRQSFNSRAGQRILRFELFAESFRGLSGGCGSVRMAWRAHADDQDFDEACQLAAGVWFKEVSRSEAARKSARRGDPDGIAPMLNVTFSTRTFALLLTLLEAIAVWNAMLSRNKFPKHTRIA
jgi:hypothetical protein